jgi:hypothetical protein
MMVIPSGLLKNGDEYLRTLYVMVIIVRQKAGHTAFSIVKIFLGY